MRNFGNLLRAEQLITPFGVGAMTVMPNGMSIIVGGLDHWFDAVQDSRGNYEIEDWRLVRRLGVSRLYSPPTVVESDDFLARSRGRKSPRIPVLRFPTWYFCKYCRRLEQRSLDTLGPVVCPDLKHAARGMKQPAMHQVPFVVVCAAGHIDDFPWRDWCHSEASNTCGGVLRFAPAGEGNPQGTRVYCDSCKRSRTLSGITSQNEDGSTFLSRNIQHGAIIKCSGRRPWLGDSPESQELCDKQIKGSFRGASNLYYSHIETSLYIPKTKSDVPEALMEMLTRPQFTACRVLSGGDVASAVSIARQMDEDQGVCALRMYSDVQLSDAFSEILGTAETYSVPSDRSDYLKMEYELLSREFNHENLRVVRPSGSYEESVRSSFDDILLVPKLVETSALWGFSRIESNSRLSFEEGRKMMFLQPAVYGSRESWLPAKRNLGEGIFLKVSEESLSKWESKPSVLKRISGFTMTSFADSYMSMNLSPRYVLLHTLSHLVMKQLIFYCGYSQASLKERIYASSGSDPMSGILIYTASGDSEGTMGGLVRMGEPGNLDQVLLQALQDAEWCSNDPVCTESSLTSPADGEVHRLSACYACCLIPETACESYNLFLDRTLVVNNSIGDTSSFFD